MQSGDIGVMFRQIEAEIGTTISLSDGFRLSQYDADDGLMYTVGDISKKLDFFERNPKFFRFIQNGEYVPFELLNFKKSFWAIEKAGSLKDPISGKNLHELHYYQYSGE